MKTGTSYGTVHDRYSFGGNELQGWIFDKLVTPRQKLRDLFLTRHADEAPTGEAGSVNWFESV